MSEWHKVRITLHAPAAGLETLTISALTAEQAAAIRDALRAGEFSVAVLVNHEVEIL